MRTASRPAGRRRRWGCSCAARPFALLTAGAALTLAVAAAPAGAAVTVGSSLPAASGDPFACSSACTLALWSLPGRSVAAPFDGVVVRWRARVLLPSRPLSDTIELRTLRSAPGGAYMGRGSDRGTPTANGQVSTFPARLPVDHGDLIGLDLAAGEAIGMALRPAGDIGLARFTPYLGYDETRPPSYFGPSNIEPLFNADIEPDRDGDGYGDETQDLCPQLKEKRTSPCVAALRLSNGRTTPAAKFGETVRYYVTVSNDGDRATALTLDASFPRQLTLVSTTVRPGTCGPVVKGAVRCALEDLPGKKSKTVIFRTKVTGIAPRAPVTSRFSVGTAVSERDLSDNTLAIITKIVTPPRCITRRSGGDLDDLIRGGDIGELLVGGRGNDRLLGRRGNDCLSGGPGNDRLHGGAGTDRAEGGPGDDRLTGGSGADRLEGGSDSDRLIGGPGRERLLGGPGDDRILAVDGRRDRINCGPGKDLAVVDFRDRVRRCERVLRRRAR